MVHTSPHRFWRSPALPGVEFRCARDSSACYAPHAHAALSIGAIDDGSSIFSRGPRRQRLVRGDVVLIPAGEVHCCNPADDGRWSYQMLYLDELWLARAVAESGHARDFNRLPENVAKHGIHRRLTHLNKLFFSDASLADQETALLLFVGDLLAPSAGARLAPRTAAPSGRLRRVQTMISERCDEALRLDELAGAAQMSRYQLLRAFRETYGMTPHAWQLDLRIQRARGLLGQGKSLADVALELGFADQSHFQRAFKERVAATPGEYRQRPAHPAAIFFKTQAR